MRVTIYVNSREIYLTEGVYEYETKDAYNIAASINEHELHARVDYEEDRYASMIEECSGNFWRTDFTENDRNEYLKEIWKLSLIIYYSKCRIEALLWEDNAHNEESCDIEDDMDDLTRSLENTTMR